MKQLTPATAGFKEHARPTTIPQRGIPQKGGDQKEAREKAVSGCGGTPMIHVANIPVVRTALELDGWLAWNEETWGLAPLRVRYGGSSPDQPRLEGVLYIDRRGRVRMPPRNPYLPFRFLPTFTTRVERVSRQWLDLCAEMADDLATRGVIGTVLLPPGLIDARPFQWLGFDVSLLYTYVTDLPIPEESIGESVRRKIRKASCNGLIFRRSEDWDQIVECLTETAHAKKWAHRTNSRSLQRLHRLAGPDAFRACVTCSSTGEMLSALLRLDVPGGTTLAWSEGTRRNALPLGVVQLGTHEDMRDAASCGAVSYDFVGANIPSIARAKADWGATLVPYVTIATPTFRNLAKHGLRIVRGLLSLFATNGLIFANEASVLFH